MSGRRKAENVVSALFTFLQHRDTLDWAVRHRGAQSNFTEAAREEYAEAREALIESIEDLAP